MQAGEQAQETREVLVWDWPVRIFHWLLVLLIALSWITSEIGGDAMTYHMWSGYTILTLVIFRILWGLFGSEHARFGSFVKGPVAVARYAGSMFRRGHAIYLGHNPLGGWSVLAMLAALALQAGTGLFANDEIFTEGPLAKLVSSDISSLLTTIHRWNFYVLLALVGIHVCAIFFYLVVKRENLIGAMFSGRKHVPSDLAPAQERIGSVWLALTIVTAAAAAVAALVNLA